MDLSQPDSDFSHASASLCLRPSPSACLSVFVCLVVSAFEYQLKQIFYRQSLMLDYAGKSNNQPVAAIIINVSNIVAYAWP